MSMGRDFRSVRDTAAKVPSERSSFGQYLQTIRIENHIRLEQVADETRIRLAILQAIEHEDFARLPAEVFTVGFLRAYAQAIGADSNEAVRQYYAQQRLRQKALAVDKPPEPNRRRFSGKLIFALATLAALIAGCLFAYQVWQGAPSPSGAPPASGMADTPPPSSVERMVTGPPSEAVKKPSIPIPPQHLLTIVAHENSWVKVVIDQGATSEHKLKAGDQLQLTAQNGFNLLIGNVSGVRLTLDNQPVTLPGKRGEVVNIHLP